jgi:hypothetical protein
MAKSYDRKLVGRNDRNGFLGEYQPVIGYMTRQEFEKITGPVTPDKIPPY